MDPQKLYRLKKSTFILSLLQSRSKVVYYNILGRNEFSMEYFALTWEVGTSQIRIVPSYEAVITLFSPFGWYITRLTFFECPFRIATTCSSSLLKTAAVLSAPNNKSMNMNDA